MKSLSTRKVKSALDNFRMTFAAKLTQNEWEEFCEAIYNKVQENDKKKLKPEKGLNRQDVILALILLKRINSRLGDNGFERPNLTEKELRTFRRTVTPQFGKILGNTILHGLSVDTIRLFLRFSPEERKRAIAYGFREKFDFYLNLPVLFKKFHTKQIENVLRGQLYKHAADFVKKLKKSRATIAISSFDCPEDIFLLSAFQHSLHLFLINLKSQGAERKAMRFPPDWWR